jgi:hypothetical protein
MPASTLSSHHSRPPSLPDTTASSSLGSWTQPRSRGLNPNGRARSPRLHLNGDKPELEDDGNSQGDSESSRDAEGVFTFRPPSTAGQQAAPQQNQDMSRRSPSATHPRSPPSEDVHTLVGSPGAGLSRLPSLTLCSSTIGLQKHLKQRDPSQTMKGIQVLAPGEEPAITRTTVRRASPFQNPLRSPRKIAKPKRAWSRVRAR